MATRSSCSAGTCDKRQSLTCALCLDVFKVPKLLPCAHTFCQECLEDLCRRRYRWGRFPCPTCRKETTLPAQGSAGFQNNFYISEDDLARARDDTEQLFCVECDSLISMDSKLSDHLHHKTQRLQEAAQQAESQLKEDRDRLKAKAEHIERTIRKRKADQDDMGDKKAAIERKFRHRHASVVAQADQFLTTALRSLEAACTATENTQSKDLATAINNLEKTNKIREKIDLSIETGEGCTLVNLAKDMRIGSQDVDKTGVELVKSLQSISRPVHVTEDKDLLFHCMSQFIGTSERITYDCSDLEVKVEEEIQCGEDPDSVVYCVCPQNDNHVYVTFEPSYKDKVPRGKIVSTASKTISTFNCKDRFSLKCTATGPPVGFHSHFPRRVYVKCGSPDYLFLEIQNFGRDKEVDVKLLTGQPHEKSRHTWQFRIHCHQLRAADVNSTGQLFAVVQEKRRKVNLFRRHPSPTQSAGNRPSAPVKRAEKARDVYQPPLTPWTPADVCFFSLGTQEVLLIADELNDAIHVVNIDDDDRLTFCRFLAPGCPLLVQPSALNTDTRGRLWVGCRGGRLLTMEPHTAVADPPEETGDGPPQ